jgi:hypothetical protein
MRDTFLVQAAVCRDDHGQINKMDTQISPPCHPNMGEALAAKLASQLALSLHLTCFILEGDSQIVILALQHLDIAQDWRIYSIIHNTIDSIPATSSW